MQKVLFVGDLNLYGRSFQRYKTFIDLGYEVHGISTVPVPFLPGINQSSFFEKMMWKISLPLDLTAANRMIREYIECHQCDIVWVEKGNTVKPGTLKYVRNYLPNTKIVSCSEDDMYASHNRSFYYRLGLPYYDVVFTTKVYNLSELKSIGAKKTVLFLDAYDEDIHKPMQLTAEDYLRFGCDVGFIGTYEEDRANKMFYLAGNGIKITIWGNGWEKSPYTHPNLVILQQPVYGEDYAKAINATKINLCFLRKQNRDEVTSRSVEIPACGGFMIAERTKRHLEFFEDKKEAGFFSSREELLNLVKKYLTNNNERKEIAKAGLLRCKNSGYEIKNQIKKMIESLR